MSLLTIAEAMRFLRLSGSDRDKYASLIGEYIPIVEEDICLYCNRWFTDPIIKREASSGIAFVRGDTDSTSSDADSITDDDEELSTNEGAGFRAGMQILVEDSGVNDGLYGLATVSSGTLTLDSTGEVESIDLDDYYNEHGQSIGTIRISRVNWPKALKPIAAKMIWYQIQDNKPSDIKSERIDDYSVTYAGNNEYPERLIASLKRWRLARSH